jgi:hypothetical protein
MDYELGEQPTHPLWIDGAALCSVLQKKNVTQHFLVFEKSLLRGRERVIGQ